MLHNMLWKYGRVGWFSMWSDYLIQIQMIMIVKLTDRFYLNWIKYDSIRIFFNLKLFNDKYVTTGISIPSSGRHLIVNLIHNFWCINQSNTDSWSAISQCLKNLNENFLAEKDLQLTTETISISPTDAYFNNLTVKSIR